MYHQCQLWQSVLGTWYMVFGTLYAWNWHLNSICVLVLGRLVRVGRLLVSLWLRIESWNWNNWKERRGNKKICEYPCGWGEMENEIEKMPKNKEKKNQETWNGEKENSERPHTFWCPDSANNFEFSAKMLTEKFSVRTQTLSRFYCFQR